MGTMTNPASACIRCETEAILAAAEWNATCPMLMISAIETLKALTS